MAAFPRGRFWSGSFNYFRSFSVAAAKELPKTTQTGIPIIIPHHVVKKAFIVHPKSRAVSPRLKHQWLTKSVFKEGLPPFSSAIKQDTELPADVALFIKERFGGSLAQTLGYQKPPKKTKKRFEEEIRFGIFQDLLRLCCTNLTDSYLDVSPKIHTHWARKHEFYQLLFHPDLILRSNREWNPFEADIEATAEETLPGPYNNYSMEVYLHPIVHLRNFPGYQAASANPSPHSHTLFLANTFGQTIEEAHAYGIMSMFGVLASTAMSRGVYPGEHLPEPLCTQCVISDGTKIVLMCFQLNTLSLQEDHGIKNCAWGTEYMPFFITDNENDSSKNNEKLYGNLNIEDGFPNVNEECIRRLLYFLCC